MSDAREQMEPGMERPPTGGIIGVRGPERYCCRPLHETVSALGVCIAGAVKCNGN